MISVSWHSSHIQHITPDGPTLDPTVVETDNRGNGLEFVFLPTQNGRRHSGWAEQLKNNRAALCSQCSTNAGKLHLANVTSNPIHPAASFSTRASPRNFEVFFRLLSRRHVEIGSVKPRQFAGLFHLLLSLSLSHNFWKVVKSCEKEVLPPTNDCTSKHVDLPTLKVISSSSTFFRRQQMPQTAFQRHIIAKKSVPVDSKSPTEQNALFRFFTAPLHRISAGSCHDIIIVNHTALNHHFNHIQNPTYPSSLYPTMKNI